MKNIKYLSAADRLNYGDLLFPIIFQRYFVNSSNFHNYGVVRSNNESFGALPTNSYKDLIKNIDPADDVIVVGGGEVFFSKWSTLFSFINPVYRKILNFKIFKKAENYLNISSHLLGGKGSFSPFLPDLNVPTVYISAGGQFPRNISQDKLYDIKNLLNSSLSLSVRDERTYESLTTHGVKCELIPDSAILMSKIFSNDYLKHKISIHDTPPKNSYLFLQLGIDKAPKDIVSFIESVNNSIKGDSIQVVCSPIGLAPGHKDDVILQKIVKSSGNWIYIQPTNLYDTMYLIANSKMYMGTSLHGAITAYAYLVPIIPLNKRVQKLDSFVKTWTTEFYINSIDFDVVNDAYERAIVKWNSSLAEKRLIEQQRIVENHFHDIQHKISSLP